VRQFLRPVVVLAMLAAAGAALLAFVHDATRPRIVANHETELLRMLSEVIPPGVYDNALVRDEVLISASELGSGTPLRAWRASRAGEPTAIAMTVVAPDGYSGPIRLLVGISAEGELLGVRVLSHRETPGLGDDIELRRSNWIMGFDGHSLDDPSPDRWSVRRDGGVFDQFSGATVTPRAVVSAVKRALLYFKAHRDWLFSQRSSTP
jgi:Na+-translocating ferredoxin:NAD+ oxidoreductase subunit G